MKKAYQFYNDTYFQTFFFLPNWTREDLIKTFRIDTYEADQGMAFSHNGAIFIWLKEFSEKNLGFLVHEVTHATNILFKERGIKATQGNDEHQAYMNQFVFDNCYKFLKRTRRKKV